MTPLFPQTRIPVAGDLGASGRPAPQIAWEERAIATASVTHHPRDMGPNSVRYVSPNNSPD